MPTRFRLLSVLVLGPGPLAALPAANLDGRQRRPETPRPRLYAEANDYVTTWPRGTTPTPICSSTGSAPSPMSTGRGGSIRTPPRPRPRPGRTQTRALPARLLQGARPLQPRAQAARRLRRRQLRHLPLRPGREAERPEAGRGARQHPRGYGSTAALGRGAAFPVLDEHRPLLLRKHLPRSGRLRPEPKSSSRCSRRLRPGREKLAGFDPIQAEALALQGSPAPTCSNLSTATRTTRCALAALSGVVQRAVADPSPGDTAPFPRRLDPEVHLSVQHLNLRDDVPEVARRSSRQPGGRGAPPRRLRRLPGARPNERAPIDAHRAYMRYLADRAVLTRSWPIPGRAPCRGRSGRPANSMRSNSTPRPA
jgi:hypothetical protein